MLFLDFVCCGFVVVLGGLFCGVSSCCLEFAVWVVLVA